jgi:hypothetical protein
MTAPSRPVYETTEDLAREREAITRAAERFEAVPRKLPRSYGLDFAWVRGKRVVAFAEVKVRKVPSTQYADYMVSLSKLIRARELWKVTRCPFYLVVEFSDGIRVWLDDAKSCPKVEFMGRTDRGDWQDEEPCALIPMDKFGRL